MFQHHETRPGAAGGWPERMPGENALAQVRPALLRRIPARRRQILDMAGHHLVGVARQEPTGYTLNSVARSLRRQESRAIIVIVPDVSQAFFSLVLRGIEERAIAVGYSVLIGNSAGDAKREALYGQHVLAGRADGLILINGRLPRFGSDTRATLPPIVVVSERIAGTDLPLVGVDNVGAAATAVRHLLELGHRRIAHIAGSRRNAMTTERCTGYRQALHQAGIPPKNEWISYGDFSIESGARAAHVLLALPQPPTAIFACNDDMAIGAMNEAKASGCRCREISR
jgi:LacI family repressor for deo operon, udp, cdd, tsx, nupC, and nupG